MCELVVRYYSLTPPEPGGTVLRPGLLGAVVNMLEMEDGASIAAGADHDVKADRNERFVGLGRRWTVGSVLLPHCRPLTRHAQHVAHEVGEDGVTVQIFTEDNIPLSMI